MFDDDTTVNGVSLLASIDRARRDYAERLARTEERLARIFASAAILEAAGFRTNLSEYTTYGICLGDVGREKLPALRKALGPMRVSGKAVANAKKRLLEITVSFKNHPDVDASYTKTMPRRKKGEPDSIRCRIVRNVTVTHALVCETGPR